MASSPTAHQSTSKNETGGDEDLDSFSDLSEVSSVQSLPSLVGDSLSASMREECASGAAEHLAALLSENPVLKSMYEAAIAKFGHERFYKNHDQLLKAFFKDLRSQTQNPVQLAAVRGLRNRDRRHEITLLMQTACEPHYVHRRRLSAVLRDQKPDRNQLLDDYFKGSISPLGDDDELSELLDENASSDRSEDGDDEPLDQDDRGTYSYFESYYNIPPLGYEGELSDSSTEKVRSDTSEDSIGRPLDEDDRGTYSYFKSY